MRFFLPFLVSISAFAAEKPDILMIAIDDLRPMLGCYGDERVISPNIDKLAERSVVFERAYCQYAKCGTSRLSLMTGLRPDAIDVFSNNEKDVIAFRERRPDAVSVAQWLKDEAGYHTQSWGKIYHDGWDNPADWSAPSQPGRDREMWEIPDPKDYEAPTIIAERLDCPTMACPPVADNHLFAGRMTDSVISFLKERDAIEKPVFLSVGFRRPHLPFIAPRKYFELYSPDMSWLKDVFDPPLKTPPMAWFNSDGYVGSAKKVGLSMPLRPNRLEAIDWNGYELRSYNGVPNQGPISRELQLDLIYAYAACISYVDAQIGRLLESVSEDTIIVLWSDHGWHLGEKSAWGKMTNYEIATRVPLIISHPDIKPGRTQALSELVDLYPTLCDFSGVEKPTHLEGESLLPALNDPSLNDKKDVALSQYSRFKKYMGYAMRTDRHRLVVWKEKATGEVVATELYNHRQDPKEYRNLADSEPELVERLTARLERQWR